MPYNNNLSNYINPDYIKERILSIIEAREWIDGWELDIKNKVHEVGMRYITAYIKTDPHCEHPTTNASFTSYEIDNNYVAISWGEQYKYNYDHGEFLVPVEYLYDESALIEFEEECIIKQKENEQQEKIKQRHDDEREFERLAEKLGENNEYNRHS